MKNLEILMLKNYNKEIKNNKRIICSLPFIDRYKFYIIVILLSKMPKMKYNNDKL